ncbi:MAG: prephenate dehydratase [Prevotella sp.]|nr:prephenate dehydratase [Prevotella sp.]
MRKVAIQGRVGSFHDIAAHAYFGGEEIELMCCATFEEVFDEVAAGRAAGMAAIENTIAGSLLHNYELLRDSGVVVTGEYKLHIEHSICCLPDDDWHSLCEVHSHPVALMQCRHYLSRRDGLKIVEAEDTAGAAELIARDRRKGWAAICHASAARRLGLRILEEQIEDNKHNYTRFLVVEDEKTASGKPGSSLPRGGAGGELSPDKANLVFALPHAEGALSKVLTILSFYDMNLTKIQSLPIIGHEWEYLFYVDVTFSNGERFRQAIDAITPLTSDLKILGVYKKYEL